MKINLDTKFNIGDTVYFPELGYDEWYPSDPATILDIMIHINNNTTTIKYYIIDKDGPRRVPIRSDWCFATCEECTKWCQENN